MVGALYKEGDPRRDAGFSLFYSGINLGGLLGGAMCIKAADTYSWNVAFSLAGIFMIIGLCTFVFTQRFLGPIGKKPIRKDGSTVSRSTEILVYAGSLLVIPFILLLVKNTAYTDLFMYIIGPITLLYVIYEMRNYTWAENKKLIAAMIFIIFSIFFWAFFEQCGGSLSLFARYNFKDTTLLGFDPNQINNSSNNFFVIILSPIFGLIWLWFNKRNLEPNTAVKFGLSFLFLGAGFFVFYATRFFATPEGMTSLGVFTFAYFVVTLGELCLSPIGLSAMTKLSPKPLWGVMMGIWFLASAYGQYVAGILGAGMASENASDSLLVKLMLYTDGYKQLGIYGLIAGVVLLVISPLIKKLMQEVK